MSEEVEEKIKAVLKNEIKKEIMSNLDSVLIFTYIQNLEKEIEEFKGIKNGTTIIYKGKAKYVREDKINKYYISKDKIREIFNNYLFTEAEGLKEFYQDIYELLEE